MELFINLQLPYSLQNKNNGNNGQKRGKYAPFKAELYSELARNNQWKDLLHTLNYMDIGDDKVSPSMEIPTFPLNDFVLASRVGYRYSFI